MPSRRRNQVDPLQLRPGDFVVHEQHGVGRFVEMMQRTVGGATREYLVIEYAAVASAASRPTGCSCRPTSSTRSPVRRRRGSPTLNKLGGSRLARRPRAGPASYVKQIAAELIRLYSARMATDGPRVRARTPRGSASSRTPSPTSRRPTSWSASTRSRPTWRARSRWTGSSAATSATARPRSRCARRSRRSRTASRSPSSCRRRCWSSSTCRPSPSATRSSRSTVRALSRFQSDKEAKRGHRRARPTARVDLVIGTHRLLSRRDPRSRTSAWSSSTRSSASASSTRSSSRRCAPPSTCWPCRPRRSRAPWRWRSPASARCPRSPRRPRSGTRSSPTSAPTTRSRSPRRSGASCCARARSSSSTTR